MEIEELEKKLKDAKENINYLQEELFETNKGTIALTIEFDELKKNLEDKIKKNNEQLRIFQEEIKETNEGTLVLNIELEKTKDELIFKEELTNGINSLFQNALISNEGSEIAQNALKIAKKLTNSKAGVILINNEESNSELFFINKNNRKFQIFLGNFDEFLHRNKDFSRLWRIMGNNKDGPIIHNGLYKEKTFDIKMIPPIRKFISIPIQFNKSIIGMFLLANKNENYDASDGATMEIISRTFIEIYMRKKTEIELKLHKNKLEVIVKKRTRELEEKTRLLESINNELERFMYVAYHHLQEPLRTVVSYVQLLQKRYSPKLNEDANIMIEYAVKGSLEMKHIINDLIEFTNINIKGQTFKLTNFNEVLDTVLLNLEHIIESNNAIITFDTLPNLKADKNQMILLFENLIENAIKFRGLESPIIKIEANENDQNCIFSVSDNGIGIEKEYHNKLFVLFQRFHSKNKYPGSGVGLAICKRIIDRHGGKIWIESIPKKGTSFYFTIPKF